MKQEKNGIFISLAVAFQFAAANHLSGELLFPDGEKRQMGKMVC